jgi:hypothetical protein
MPKRAEIALWAAMGFEKRGQLGAFTDRLTAAWLRTDIGEGSAVSGHGHVLPFSLFRYFC